jgi:iron complex outermembrane receptor protein
MRHAIAGLLAGIFVSASFAQDDAVVITAPRFPEDARRLPASVSVLTQEDIQRSAARTLPELLQSEVGFTMKDLFGNNAATTSIDLRGFGVTGAQNTLILLDGRRLNDFDLSGVQWAAIPLASIERIEIMRGTGAVLYGDAATAGVVNIVTRSPLAPGVRASVLGRAATFDTLEGQLYGSTATGSFGINGTLYGYGSDGYRDNNRNEQKNSAVNLRWAMGDGSLDLRAGTDEQELRLPGGRFVQPSKGLDQYAADPRGATTPLDYASRDGRLAGLTLLQRFGGVEAVVGLDWRDKDQRSYFDQNGFPTYRADGLELTSLTPRVKIPVGGHTLVAGVDLHQWRYDSRRTNRPENLGQPTNVVKVEQDTTGVFLQGSFQLPYATILTAGWRSERAKYKGEDRVDLAAPPCTVPFATCAAAPAVEETQKAEAWELGARHALSRQWQVFGRAGQSFRFVNAEELYENNAFFAPQFQVLRPQQAETLEGGVEWRNGGHALRLTLFRIDVTDEIHLDPFTTGVGNTNLPPSRREGFELDGRASLTRNLKLNAAYAHTEAKFLEGTLAGSPSAIGTNMPIAGNTVPLVPKHKLNLGLAWDVTARTLFSAAFTYVSEQVLDNDEPNTLDHRIPSYYLMDLKLAQRFDWGRISATVNNLFDEKYYNYAVRSAFTPDRYSVYPLPGRSVGLALEIVL